MIRFIYPLRPMILVSLLLACSGCWEEVRYDPSSHNLSKEPTLPRPEVHEVAILVDDIQNEDPQDLSPTTDELFTGDSPVTESVEPEQPMIEEAVAQPDELLASVLDSQQDHASGTDSPAPPSEFDWFDDSPVAEPKELIESTALPRTAIAAWRMGSKWSLAAAYFAKGQGASRTNEPLEQAGYAATLLEIELPALPENSENTSLQQTVIRYLLEESGPQLTEQLRERFSADHAALAELAIKTHALLLIYTPGNKDLEPIVSAISLAAEKSGLPETVWRSLVDLLEQRKDFVIIKRAVFDLHDQTGDFLAGSAVE